MCVGMSPVGFASGDCEKVMQVARRMRIVRDAVEYPIEGFVLNWLKHCEQAHEFLIHDIVARRKTSHEFGAQWRDRRLVLPKVDSGNVP